MDPAGWLQSGVLLLLGVVVGSWIASRIAQRRFASQLHRTADELLQRHAASAQDLKVSQQRAQNELEQARQEFQRQLAQAAKDHGEAASRIEAHLIASYDEIERVRADTRAGHASGRDSTDGFAATQPMGDVP